MGLVQKINQKDTDYVSLTVPPNKNALKMVISETYQRSTPPKVGKLLTLKPTQ